MSCNGLDVANGLQDVPPPLAKPDLAKLDLAKPDLTKPDLSAEEASALLYRVYGLRVTRDDGIAPLDSYSDQNFRVLADEPSGGYALKVFRSGEGEEREFVLLQSEVTAFLHGRGFPVPEQVATLRGEATSVETVVRGAAGRTHVVWLLTLLEGRLLSAIPRDGHLCFQVGRLAAGVDRALLEFHSPLASCLEHSAGGEWDLCSLASLGDRVSLLPSERARGVVGAVVDQFRRRFLDRRHAFRSGLIHGDFNDNNLLAVASSAGGAQRWRVSGLLDFGDMSLGYLVFELAIAMAYMMIDAPEPVAVGGHVMAGYESVLPLSDEERSALFLVVLARLSQSALNAWHNVALYPQNEHYLMVSAPKALVLLCHLWDLGAPVVEERWRHTARQYKLPVAN